MNTVEQATKFSANYFNKRGGGVGRSSSKFFSKDTIILYRCLEVRVTIINDFILAVLGLG
jgi:hypothetical protein